jgi:hypothetical protein
MTPIYSSAGCTNALPGLAQRCADAANADDPSNNPYAEPSLYFFSKSKIAPKVDTGPSATTAPDVIDVPDCPSENLGSSDHTDNEHVDLTNNVETKDPIPSSQPSPIIAATHEDVGIPGRVSLQVPPGLLVDKECVHELSSEAI